MGSQGSFAKAVQKIVGRSLRETGAALKRSGEAEVCMFEYTIVTSLRNPPASGEGKL
jgi:hypothetical protein